MIKECVNGIRDTVQNNAEKLWEKFLRRVALIALIGIVDTEWTRWHISTPSNIELHTPDNTTKLISSE
ncbi:hypothetical protein SPSIL_005940 [Sporomusa silvacetica DSM 10669]|uniref:Uncharacterized protein n=1 Tax=Sporomusa silvacetica DSM 10669 TaxID=1123289 RepID=A0ABZ3IFP0_9FIRM|nr:hypothetical protein [Sporomusa silvacetica]OZC17081.1 hypothetical protein SPSIL_34460 [Sporomusa silvacetica DSM 10669]